MRITNKKNKRKVFKITSGFRGAPNRLYRSALQYGVHAMVQSYKGRKLKKRSFRRLWITRINSIARTNDTNYSALISTLKRKQIHINRKILAQISCFDPFIVNSITKI